MEIGQRVRILSSMKSTYKDVIGKIGTIKRFNGISLGVKVDNLNNVYSGVGLYWINHEEAELIEQEEEKMEKLTGYKAVAVVNNNFNCYEYYAIYEDGNTYKENDNILSEDNKIELIYKIITPEQFRQGGDDIFHEVKAKIDTTAYQERVKNRAEAKCLKKEMDKKIKEMDEVNKYEMYAKQNPELGELLEKYKELVG